MKRPVLFSIFFILIVIACNAQESTISEYDLYGCWVLEKKTRPSNNIVVYKSCEDVDYKNKKSGSKITLLAFNESEHESTNSYVCNSTITEKGTWNFDYDTQTVRLFYGHEFLKILKESDPEEYANWGSPIMFEKIKFKVNSIKKNQLIVEIISKNTEKIKL